MTPTPGAADFQDGEAPLEPERQENRRPVGADELNSRFAEDEVEWQCFDERAQAQRLPINNETWRRIEEALNAHCGPMARRYGLDAAEALDCKQDALLAILEHSGRVLGLGPDPIKDWRLWLLAILRNSCRRLRRRKSLVQTGQVPDVGAPSSEVAKVETSESYEACFSKVNRALGHKPRLLEVFLLHLQDLSYHQIATLLNISAKRVKSRLHEARTTLRKFGKDYWTEPGTA